MSDMLDDVNSAVRDANAQTIGLVEELFSVASPDAVFGAPVSAHDLTVLTASEVWVGMGYGFGAGGGGNLESEEVVDVVSSNGDEEASVEEGETGFGVGGGGGGGGFSAARPVAAITIGPNGVDVEPILDVTKVALAFFTMLGAMFIMFGRMSRMAKDLS